MPNDPQVEEAQEKKGPLNDPQIKAKKPRSARYDVSVGDDNGLVLRVWPNGTKTFTVAYTANNGARRRLKLGVYPTLTLAAAKDRAKEIQVAVKNGADPQGEKKKARATLHTALTLKQLLAKWQASPDSKKWRPASRRYFAVGVSQIPPYLLNRPAKELLAADVGHLLDQPVAWETLRAGYNWARKRAMVPHSPCTDLRRSNESKRPKDKAFTNDMLRGIIAAEPGPLVTLVMFTAVREHQARALRWKDIIRKDENGKYTRAWVWSCPGEDTKTGDPHQVPLVPEVVRLLIRQRWTTRWAKSEYMFPTVSDVPCEVCGAKGHAPKLSSKVAARLKTAAGVKGHGFLHRFRHTVYTRTNIKGVDYSVRELLLGHRLPGPYDEANMLAARRAALTWWAGVLAGLPVG